MSCVACAVGLYEECLSPTPTTREGWIIPCGMEELETPVKQRESRFLDPDELGDDVSAGRKRAVVVAPILDGMRCEWEGLKFAGGGVFPILGCRGNTLAKAKSTEEAKAKGADEVGHVHHGPDKSVLNNSPGLNLHRVCSRCHNRWHALNNAFYPESGRPHPSRPFVPNEPYFDHDPQTTFTDAEFEAAEAWWGIRDKSKRPAYPFKPEGVRVRFPLSEPAATVATATHNPFETDMETQHEQDLPLP